VPPCAPLEINKPKEYCYRISQTLHGYGCVSLRLSPCNYDHNIIELVSGMISGTS